MNFKVFQKSVRKVVFLLPIRVSYNFVKNLLGIFVIGLRYK
jgi:hypothetical protein